MRKIGSQGPSHRLHRVFNAKHDIRLGQLAGINKELKGWLDPCGAAREELARWLWTQFLIVEASIASSPVFDQ